MVFDWGALILMHLSSLQRRQLTTCVYLQFITSFHQPNCIDSKEELLWRHSACPNRRSSLGTNSEWSGDGIATLRGAGTSGRL
jgi:hypothetical protein